MKPAKAGENAVTVQATKPDRSSLASADGLVFRLGFSSLNSPVAVDPIEAQPTDTTGGFAVSGLPLSVGGWWQVAVTVRQVGQPDVILPFYLLLPDPNVNGADAVETPLTDARAEALYQQGMARLTALHRLRYRQAMLTGEGTGLFTEIAVDDGTDGHPPGSSYQMSTGSEMIVVGEQRWLRQPGEAWEVGKTRGIVPPSEWDEEYLGATGFQLGPVEEIRGEQTQAVSFVVPERTEPRPQAAAWWVWWIGLESGQVYREVMISRSHYMINDFTDFDAPVVIEPPTDAQAGGTPAASPAATPGSS